MAGMTDAQDIAVIVLVVPAMSMARLDPVAPVRTIVLVRFIIEVVGRRGRRIRGGLIVRCAGRSDAGRGGAGRSGAGCGGAGRGGGGGGGWWLGEDGGPGGR